MVSKVVPHSLYIYGIDEKDVDDYLTSCVNSSLSVLPQLNYLNDIVKDCDILPSVISNLVFKYFDKCHMCENYFDEDKITYCKCIVRGDNKLIWCVYCAHTHLHGNYCSSCISPDYDFSDTEVSLKCMIKDCKYSVVVGSNTISLYCERHAVRSLLIYHRLCNFGVNTTSQHYYGISRCTNSGTYISSGAFYCKLHKPKTYLTAFLEGISYNDNHITPCTYCNVPKLIHYKCSCGRIRCVNCAFVDMFIICDKKENELVHCCTECLYNHVNLFENIGTDSYRFISDSLVSCRVYRCNGIVKYYDHKHYSFFCSYHSVKKYCDIDNFCKHDYCSSISLNNKKYCKYHDKLSELFNFSE